jgi:hypothetical protein
LPYPNGGIDRHWTPRFIDNLLVDQHLASHDQAARLFPAFDQIQIDQQPIQPFFGLFGHHHPAFVVSLQNPRF